MEGHSGVAGNAGGIPLQMADGVGGLLVEGIEACAAAVAAPLKDRDRAIDAGDVPDAKTILKIARALGPEVIEQLHRQVVDVAKPAGVLMPAFPPMIVGSLLVGHAIVTRALSGVRVPLMRLLRLLGGGLLAGLVVAHNIVVAKGRARVLSGQRTE